MCVASSLISADLVWSLREASPLQNGWIFGKVPNGLWPPPIIFGKLCCGFRDKNAWFRDKSAYVHYGGTVIYYMIIFPMRCILYNSTTWVLVEKMFLIFMLKIGLDWKWPPPSLPLGTFLKIHPFWYQYTSLIGRIGSLGEVRYRK